MHASDRQNWAVALPSLPPLRGAIRHGAILSHRFPRPGACCLRAARARFRRALRALCLWGAQYYFETIFPRIPKPVENDMIARLTGQGLPAKALGNGGQGGPDRRGVEEPNRRPASVKVRRLCLSSALPAPPPRRARLASPPSRRCGLVRFRARGLAAAWPRALQRGLGPGWGAARELTVARAAAPPCLGSRVAFSTSCDLAGWLSFHLSVFPSVCLSTVLTAWGAATGAGLGRVGSGCRQPSGTYSKAGKRATAAWAPLVAVCFAGSTRAWDPADPPFPRLRVFSRDGSRRRSVASAGPPDMHVRADVGGGGIREAFARLRRRRCRWRWGSELPTAPRRVRRAAASAPA
jgi:hypothetical protein